MADLGWVCNRGYRHMENRDYEVMHPSWVHYRNNLRTADATGCSIHCTALRADVRAFRTVWTLLTAHVEALSVVVFGFGFLYQVYWEAHIVSMCMQILQSPSVLDTAGSMRTMGRRLERNYQNTRYHNGSLRCGPVGLQPLGNPSERMAPLAMYYYLCKHMRQLRHLSGAIADYLCGAGTVLSVSIYCAPIPISHVPVI